MVKYHINARGLPSVCKAGKNGCPFGGQDGKSNHFDNLEDAQNFADEMNERSYGFLATDAKGEFVPDEFGVYTGTYNIEDSNTFEQYMHYKDHLNTLPKRTVENMVDAAENFSEINSINAPDVFRGGFKDGGTFANFDHNIMSESNEDRHSLLEVEITQVEDNVYHASGNLHERTKGREDFENEDKYQEYLEDMPEKETNFEYTFTGEDLAKDFAKNNRSKEIKDAINSGSKPSEAIPGAMIESVHSLIKGHLSNK